MAPAVRAAARAALGLALLCDTSLAAGRSASFLATPAFGDVPHQVSCVADGQPCANDVKCCGVCKYKGADTAMCEACTPPGEECVPVGNPCCDGGTEQPGQAGYVCAVTSEKSEKYPLAKHKYTCQRPAAVALPQASAALAAPACVAHGEHCAEGADCCGVCASKGSDLMVCEACTPPGEECIPMGNPCCDGGTKRPGQELAQPAHVCAATNEKSEKYPRAKHKYTCQQRTRIAAGAVVAR